MLDAARAVKGRRGAAAARRRLQAAHLALLVPGARRGRPAPAGGGQGGDRPADRDRADGRARSRRRARGGRRGAARRAQHAELHAAHRGRPGGQAGAAQARALGHARGALDGRGVRAQGGQRERAALRARDPHLRAELPLHARPDGRAGAARADPPADRGRPEPRRGQALARGAAVAGGRRSGRRRGDRRGPPVPRGGGLRRPAGALRGRVRRLPAQARGGGGAGRQAVLATRLAEDRHPRRGPDRRLDRPGRQGARRGRRGGRLRPRSAAARARASSGAIDRLGGLAGGGARRAELCFACAPWGASRASCRTRSRLPAGLRW